MKSPNDYQLRVTMRRIKNITFCLTVATVALETICDIKVTSH